MFHENKSLNFDFILLSVTGLSDGQFMFVLVSPTLCKL